MEEIPIEMAPLHAWHHIGSIGWFEPCSPFHWICLGRRLWHIRSDYDRKRRCSHTIKASPISWKLVAKPGQTTMPDRLRWCTKVWPGINKCIDPRRHAISSGGRNDNLLRMLIRLSLHQEYSLAQLSRDKRSIFLLQCGRGSIMPSMLAKARNWNAYKQSGDVSMPLRTTMFLYYFQELV